MAKIEVRCSDSEKEVWVQAAGGPRELSAWVRETLDARVNRGLGEPEAEPVILEPGQGARGAVREFGEALQQLAEADDSRSPVAAVFENRERQGCPRQHFHSRGQWCKTCGRTT